MRSPAESIQAYILAKDGNRPHLLADVFLADAELRMVVQTAAISFPPTSTGRAAIAGTLVRRFNQTYENIYTLCIGAPPLDAVESFTCGWLVAMSEKQTGNVRVGCGSYGWSFVLPGYQVRALTITVAAMETLPGEMLAPVMGWISSLPYPWCAARLPGITAPEIVPLRQVLRTLARTGV